MYLKHAAYFLDESMILNEDTNSTATKKCKNIIRNKINTKRYGFNLDDPAENANGDQAMPDGRSWLQSLEFRFRTEILIPCGASRRDNDFQKFEPGLMRIAIDECNWPGATFATSPKLKKLAAINGILYLHHKNEYDMELQGQTFNSLCELFSEEIPAELRRQAELAANADNGNTNNTPLTNRENNGEGWNGIRLNPHDYEIRSIDTFEESAQYRQWTGATDYGAPWCLTSSETTYNYFRDGGATRIYFVMRRNYRDIRPIDEHIVYDAYGLSLMCIQIYADGRLKYCTSRYNHAGRFPQNCPHNGTSTDKIFTDDELCQVFGINNLNELFPPYSAEELRQLGHRSNDVSAIQNLLDEYPDETPAVIFNYHATGYYSYIHGDITLVKYERGVRYAAFIRDHAVLNNTLYKDAFQFMGEYACVLTDANEYQIINTAGDVINTFAATRVEYPTYGLPTYNMQIIKVFINNKRCNLFNMRTGKFLFNRTFNDIDVNSISMNKIRVKIDNNWTLINTRGKVLLPESNYKQIFNTNNNYVCGITNDDKIDIINVETGNIVHTQFKTNNDAISAGKKRLDLFRFNHEKLALLPVLINDTLQSIFVNTNGERINNKPLPFKIEQEFGNCAVMLDLPGIVTAVKIPVGGARNAYTIVDKNGKKLIPGPGFGHVTLTYNAAIAKRRDHYDLYNLKTGALVLTARDIQSNISSVKGARYIKLNDVNGTTADRSSTYCAIYDTYKNETVIGSRDDNFCSDLVFLSSDTVNKNDAFRYIVTRRNNSNSINIYDINRREYLFPDNTICGVSHSSTGIPGIIKVRTMANNKYNYVKLDTEGFLLDHSFDGVYTDFNKDGIAIVTINNTQYYVNTYGDMSTNPDVVEESARARRYENILNEKNDKYLNNVSYLLD